MSLTVVHEAEPSGEAQFTGRQCSWPWNTHHREEPLTANMLVPGMRVLGLLETGFLESARVEDVYIESNDVMLTWLSGDDMGQTARFPISRLRVYSGHRVSINIEDELQVARELALWKREQRHLCARERDAASMQVPDADTKRILVPLMIQMIDAKPLADEFFELIPERTAACSDAELCVYARQKRIPSQSRRKLKPVSYSSETETDEENVLHPGASDITSDDEEYDLPDTSDTFFPGIHPDEARASDAQLTVDLPVAKAALAKIFRSLIGQEDNLRLR